MLQVHVTALPDSVNPQTPVSWSPPGTPGSCSSPWDTGAEHNIREVGECHSVSGGAHMGPVGYTCPWPIPCGPSPCLHSSAVLSCQASSEEPSRPRRLGPIFPQTKASLPTQSSDPQPSLVLERGHFNVCLNLKMPQEGITHRTRGLLSGDREEARVPGQGEWDCLGVEGP